MEKEEELRQEEPKTKQEVEKQEAHPQRLILTYVAVSMGFGLIPIPLLDIAAVTAVQMEMLRQLSKKYGADWSDVSGRYFITSQAGVTLARLAAGAIKTIPGVGTVIGAAAQAVLSGASTFAIGQVFLKHFGEKKGSFEDFDPKAYKKYYKEQFKKGKKVAEEVGEEEADKHEGESLETIELTAESLENEATRNFLERSSDAFVGFYKIQVDKARNWRKKEVAPNDLLVEELPEDLKVDPAEIEAEQKEEQEEEALEDRPNFFSRTSDKFMGYYQNWRNKEEEPEAEDINSDTAVETVIPEEVAPVEEEEDESFLEKSSEALMDIYDSSLGKGVKWVSSLGKKKDKEEDADTVAETQPENETE